METVLRLMVNNVVIGDCQYTFTKDKSCLTNLVTWEDLLEPLPIPTGSLQEGWRGTKACMGKGNGLKLFLLGIRKKFLIVRVVRHRHKLHREAVGSPFTGGVQGQA